MMVNFILGLIISRKSGDLELEKINRYPPEELE